MSAIELRKYITLLESSKVVVNEIDISRRNLFKSAAAIAAIAALPAPVKHQAVELIKDKGPDLLRLAIEVGKKGFGARDFVETLAWVQRMEKGTAVSPLEPFPTNSLDQASEIYTKLAGGRQNTYLSPDYQMEILLKTWQNLNLGNPKFYHMYQLFKEFPSELNVFYHDAWNNIRDFVPGAKSYIHGLHGIEDNSSGLDIIMHQLQQAKGSRAYNEKIYQAYAPALLSPNANELSRQNAEYYKSQMERDNKQVKELEARLAAHQKASQAFGSSPKSQGVQTPATTDVGSGIQAASKLPTVMRAVETILNAFNKGVKISDSMLKALDALTPENLKKTDTKPGGATPEIGEPEPDPSKRRMFGLPAPGPKIDIGLGTPADKAPVPKSPGTES